MIKISLLKEGNWFKHKNCTYEIMSFDYVFTTAKKLNNDGIKHYFLNSIQVEKMYKDHYQKDNPDYGITDSNKKCNCNCKCCDNPNHDISDLRKQNND